jgi:hypothetical protein
MWLRRDDNVRLTRGDSFGRVLYRIVNVIYFPRW